MNPILPHPYKKPRDVLSVYSPRSFFYGWNNLCIPACLKFNSKAFDFTSPGWRICSHDHQKESGTYYSVLSRSFFMSRATSASRPALNRKSSRISDDYEIVGNKRAACFTSGREDFSIPSFLQKCHSQNPSPAIPVELHRPAILMFMARTRKFHRNFCRPADFRSHRPWASAHQYIPACLKFKRKTRKLTFENWDLIREAENFYKRAICNIFMLSLIPT